MKANAQFKVGDKVKLRFPSEVFPEGIEINNLNCNILFEREGFGDAGWAEEMNTLIKEESEGTITSIHDVGYWVEGTVVTDSYFFPASCLELVEPEESVKVEKEEPKSLFKKGDTVVRDWDKEHEYPITVGRILRDIDTQDEFIVCVEWEDTAIVPTDCFVKYDPKAVRKKEIENQIKALEEELKNL